jgi:purine-binding chemotaxis protein CheW
MTHSNPPTQETRSTADHGDAEPLRFRERVRQRLGSSELLIFGIGREWFGLELQAVEEVVDAPDLREIPECPAVLLGVFPLRGELVPLYTPRAVLGTPGGGHGLALVMRSGHRRVALAVDDVDEVTRVELSDLREPPPGVAADDALLGVLVDSRRLVAVLDARAIVGACAAATTLGPT